MNNFSAYNGNKPYIFVSYSHKDRDIVMQMVNQMIGDGYRVWYDEGIEPGSEWDEFIANKINNSGLFLAFISKNYLESDNCKDELNYSRDYTDNILLVYLESVKLPSGMELRFGRTQAILAFNYSSKEEFFQKFYSTRDIEAYREYAIPGAGYLPLTPVTIPMAEPTINAPIRVDKPRSDNKKKYIIAIGAIILAFLIIATVVIVVVLNSYSKNNETSNDNKKNIVADDEDDEDEETTSTSEELVTSSSETTLNSEVSNTSVATVTTADIGEGYEYENMYSLYQLTDGETYYDSVENQDYYNYTDVVVVGYMEGDSYQNGVFHGTDTMSIKIPVINGYSDPVAINWYYINSNNEIEYLLGEDYVVPTIIDGDMYYANCIHASNLAGEGFKMGTYYVTVSNPSNGLDMSVTRVFYSADGI